MRHRKKYRQLPLSFIAACAGLAWLTPVPPAAAQSAPAAVKPASVNLLENDKFSTAAAAAAHCPGDTVVWSTLSKYKVFHLSNSKYYGKTRHGAYVCEKDAVAAGYHASKR